jgi:hypothetical protein
MKKLVFISVPVFLTCMLVLYAVGAFVAVSWNPACWSIEGRVLYGLFGTIVSSGVAAAVTITEFDD